MIHLSEGQKAEFDGVLLTLERYHELIETETKHEKNRKMIRAMQKVLNDNQGITEDEEVLTSPKLGKVVV